MPETSVNSLSDDFSKYTEEYSENTLNELLDGKVRHEISELKKKIDLEKNKCLTHLSKYEEEIEEHQKNIDELKPQADKEWQEYNNSGKKEQKARNEANKNREKALKKEAKEDEEELSEADKAKEAARLKANESVQFSKDASNHLESYERLQQEIDKEIELRDDKKNRKEQLELASEWLDFFFKEADYLTHLHKHNYFCRRLHTYQDLVTRLFDLKSKYCERDNKKLVELGELFTKESKSLTQLFRQLYCDCYLEISHLIEDAQNEKSIKHFKIIKGYNDLIKEYKDLCNTEEELVSPPLLSLENGNRIVTLALDTDSPCPAIDLVLEEDCCIDFITPTDDVDEVKELFKNIMSSRNELINIEGKYFEEVKKSVSNYMKTCFDSVKSIAKDIETCKSNTVALTKSYNKHHTSFELSSKGFENNLESKNTPIKEMKSLIEKENNIIKEQYLQSVVVELGKIRSDPLDCGLEQYKTLRQIDIYNVANDVLSSTKITNEFYLILLPLREIKQRLLEENYKYQWFVALFKLIELGIIAGGPMNKSDFIDQLTNDIDNAINKLESLKDELSSTYTTVKNKMDELDSKLVLMLNKADEFNTYRDDDIYRNLTNEAHYCARQLGNTKDSLRGQYVLIEKGQQCCENLLEQWNCLRDKIDSLSNGELEERNLLEEQQVDENNEGENSYEEEEQQQQQQQEDDENVNENKVMSERIPAPPANSPENMSNNYEDDDEEEQKEQMAVKQEQQQQQQQFDTPTKEDQIQDSEIVDNSNNDDNESSKRSVQEIPAPAVSTDDFKFSVEPNDVEGENVTETEGIIKPEAPSDDINQEQLEIVSPPAEPPLEQPEEQQPQDIVQEEEPQPQEEQPQEEQQPPQQNSPQEQEQQQQQQENSPQEEEQQPEDQQQQQDEQQEEQQQQQQQQDAQPQDDQQQQEKSDVVKPKSPKKATTPTSKPAAKTAAKPGAKPAAKPGAKPTNKVVTKIPAKPAAKPGAKPATKTTAKPATKPATKPPAKAAAAKPHPVDPETGLVPKKEDIQPTESSNQDIEELPLNDGVEGDDGYEYNNNGNDGITDDDQIEVYLPDTPAENEDEYEHLNDVPINAKPRDISAEVSPSRKAVQQQQQVEDDEQYDEEEYNENQREEQEERRRKIKELSPKDNQKDINDSTNSHEISFNLWKNLLMCHVENFKVFYPTSFDMYYLDIINVIDKIAKNLNIIFYSFRDQHKIYNKVYSENKKKALITANVTVLDSLIQRNFSESDLFDKNYPRVEYRYLMYERKLQYESFGCLAYEEFLSIEKELNEFQNKFKPHFLENPKSVKCLQLVHLILCEIADDNKKISLAEQKIMHDYQLLQHYYNDLNSSYETSKVYLKKAVTPKFKTECDRLLEVAKKYKILGDKYNKTLMGRGESGFACCFGGASKAKNYPNCEKNWVYKREMHDELSRS